MQKILVLVLIILLSACAGGNRALSTTPETNSIESASDQAQVLPTPKVAPTIETLPGKEFIPISTMAAEIPWLPLDENSVPMTSFIGINASVPPFDNPLVRRAFSLAIDRQKISDGDKSRGRETSAPATTFIPPQTLGFDLYQVVGLAYDPVAAKVAFSEAGISDVSQLPPVEIVFYEGSLDLVKAYQEMWKNVLNVDVILVPVKSAAELYTYIDEKKPGLFILGIWIADYNDPHNFTFDTFFHPDSHYPALGESEFDELITQAEAAANNPAERQRLYIDAEIILCEEQAFVIPVTHALISK